MTLPSWRGAAPECTNIHMHSLLLDLSEREKKVGSEATDARGKYQERAGAATLPGTTTGPPNARQPALTVRLSGAQLWHFLRGGQCPRKMYIYIYVYITICVCRSPLKAPGFSFTLQAPLSGQKQLLELGTAIAEQQVQGQPGSGAAGIQHQLLRKAQEPGL